MQLSGISSDTRTLFSPSASAGSASPRLAGQAPAAPADVPAVAVQRVDEDLLGKKVEAVNDAFKAADAHLQFTVHKGSSQIVIKLVDDTTKEVIREIPSEKFLDLVDSLQKIAGLHVDMKL